jgi:hypothetical protein
MLFAQLSTILLPFAVAMMLGIQASAVSAQTGGDKHGWIGTGTVKTRFGD